ncbi:formyltransferase family protein [Flavobacterium davisii]|nr:formyltransferase family protein [Flavobacterium davisii]
MLNVILCGYRNWSHKIFQKLLLNKSINVLDVIHTQNDFIDKIKSFHNKVDIILFVGWSWIIPDEITDNFLCLGIHPSDLPLYRGGSPIQHQIIEGVKKSKISLMTLTSKLDSGDIWGKEDLDLSGDTIIEIFENITAASIKLLEVFFSNYPNILPVKQNLTEGTYRKRRTEKQSAITLDQMKSMKLEQIYDFIRCLTDPYPNAYIEDEQGNKLFFQGVKYVSNDK